MLGKHCRGAALFNTAHEALAPPLAYIMLMQALWHSRQHVAVKVIAADLNKLALSALKKVRARYLTSPCSS